MCVICQTAPHWRGCPFAQPPKTVFFCDSCGRAVTEGEEGYQLGDGSFCEDCVEQGRFIAECEE